MGRRFGWLVVMAKYIIMSGGGFFSFLYCISWKKNSQQRKGCK